MTCIFGAPPLGLCLKLSFFAARAPTRPVPSDAMTSEELPALAPRPLQPFRTDEEYLWAMKEDLAYWLTELLETPISPETFLEQMETGVLLWSLATEIIRRKQLQLEGQQSDKKVHQPLAPHSVSRAQPGTFLARDNISRFITWCHHSVGIKECLLFETDDLVLRKNEKNFILCLSLSWRWLESGQNAELEQPQLEKSNSMRSLHERVIELLNRCDCPSQFPMIRVSDGKYRIGDTKVLIFVRILRTHIMVRVGGGWDTLEHYLDKHDPCRCKSGHRTSVAAKLSFKQSPKGGAPKMQVIYTRPPALASTGGSMPTSPQLRRRSAPYGGEIPERGPSRCSDDSLGSLGIHVRPYPSSSADSSSETEGLCGKSRKTSPRKMMKLGAETNEASKISLKAQSTEDIYRNGAMRGRSPRVESPNSLGERKASNPSANIPRSRSHTGDELEGGLCRVGPGRYSYRNPRPATASVDAGRKTWTFRQRSQRPALEPGDQVLRSMDNPCPRCIQEKILLLQ
ncbi:GAS2L1 [Cordylochernes scorpioides]|uniref:GAS2L1 n=1 Tax=Cordylochernes scorpioides TaxID=51811 RepID=A0ABY6K9N1_9ARAC|nr:GAS2L1 [Cordylochernes scorpioides]